MLKDKRYLIPIALSLIPLIIIMTLALQPKQDAPPFGDIYWERECVVWGQCSGGDMWRCVMYGWRSSETQKLEYFIEMPFWNCPEAKLFYGDIINFGSSIITGFYWGFVDK